MKDVTQAQLWSNIGVMCIWLTEDEASRARFVEFYNRIAGALGHWKRTDDEGVLLTLALMESTADHIVERVRRG